MKTIESLAARFAAWARRVGEMTVAWGFLAIAFALAGALILYWGKGQTFINDEWNYLVVYRGWSFETLLAPQNGHLVVLPRLIYRLLFDTVGAGSHFPYQVVTVVLHLTVATIFFLLARRRVQLVVAVALTLLVAFFGVAWDTVMGAYEVPNLTGMAGGLGMLLALERRTRGGDIAACALLAVSLASFSVGIAFALGALLSIWLGGRKQWKRAWVVLVPLIPYICWFIWARKFHQSEVSAEAVSSIFSGIADQVAAICAGITGLYRVPGSVGIPAVLELRPDWGYPLALILFGLVVLHVRRAPRSIYFWTLVGVLLFYFALVAAGLSPARTPNAGRYVYMGGILALLLIAELAREIKWSTAGAVLAVAIFGLSLMANVAELRPGGRLFQAEAETNQATLAALELSHANADTGLFVEDEHETTHSHPDMFFPAWAYFETVEEVGSPAFSLDQLRATGSGAREAADQEFVRMLEIEAKPLAAPRIDPGGTPPSLLSARNGQARTRGGCLVLTPDRGHSASFQIEVPAGGFSYRTAPGAEVVVKLGRFADTDVTELPPVTGSAEIAIPGDNADTPWRAELSLAARTLACAR